MYFALSTDQETSPDRNAVDAQVQDFALNEELRLPMLKAFVQYLVHYMIHEMPDVFSLCLLALSIAAQQSTALRQARTPHPTLPRWLCRGQWFVVHSGLQQRKCKILKVIFL